MKTLEKINNFLKVSLATAAVIAMPHTTCFETYADADSYQNWRHINDSDGLIGQIRTNSRVSSVSNDYPDVVGAKAIIKANGSIEDIIINRGDNLSITFQLYPLLDYDVNVDWWGVAHADSSWYYLDNSMQWTQFDGNFSNCHPVYSGPLFWLKDTEVLNKSDLPADTYTFWFAVDSPMDGILDPNGRIVYDKVNVVVQ